MIRILAAATFACALGGVALAQDASTPAPAPAATFTTACPALPPVPTMPDGATARERDMAAGDTAMQAWNAEYVATINGCRQAEVREREARLRAAIAAAQTARAEYDAALAAYNTDSAVATNAAAQWMAEVDEFNTRNARPRRN